MTPFTLNDVLAQPDLLPNHRHTLFFPTLPGGGNAKNLAIREASVEIGQRKIGHVRVNLYGYSLGFRGHHDFDNSISIQFFEDSHGNTLKTLNLWLDKCCDWRTNASLKKAGYAVPCTLIAFDTRGQTAYLYSISNVFPLSVSTPNADSNSTGPCMVQAAFSCDFPDLIGVGSNTGVQAISSNGAPAINLQSYGLSSGSSVNPAAQNALASLAAASTGPQGMTTQQINSILT